MIQQLPAYISILFALTVIASIVWFYLAGKSKSFLLVVIVWTILQSVLALQGLFLDTQTIPPKIILLGVFPALVAIVITFLTAKGRTFIDNINLKTLTYFNTIRMPVEIVLLLLYKQGLVPIYMTFEGTNFDLFSGLTASIVAYLAFRGGRVNKKLLTGWNILCLLLLLNVVITAVLAFPTPFQKISFDQPNVAVLYFPFNLLPAVVVPLVLFSHLVALKRLISPKAN